MTVRLFVGVGGNDEDLEFQSVLHYSIEKYASEPVDLTWMRLSRDPQSFWYSDPQKNLGWSTKSWHTPFSALRWGIPAACGFEGRAIYIDIDMILRDDIAKLWNQPLANGAAMIAHQPNICVSMYDNARMKNALPPIDHIKRTGAYREIRRRFAADRRLVQQIKGGNWNCLDVKRIGSNQEYKSVEDPEIKLLHFTRVSTQPHLRYAIPRLKKEGRAHWYTFNREEPIREHPRKDALKLFDRLLEEADKAGYGIERYRNPTPFGDYGRR